MSEKESILIVDDNESICRTLRLILEKKGYETETAGTGREAIEKAQARFFNLAFLDIRLPDMAGIELLVHLKEMRPDVAVILVTGHASLKTAVQALNEGASGYITKPLDMDDVVSKARDVLEKQRLVIENRRLYQAAQRELAERKRVEEALERRAVQLATLNRIGHHVASILDQQKLLQRAVDAVQADLGYLRAAVLLLDEETSGLYVAAATDNFWEIIPDSYRQPVGKGAIGIAAETGKTVLVKDASTDSRPYRVGEWFSPSSLSVPINVGGRVIGVVEVEADVPNAFDENDQAALEAMADQIAIAIENARLYADIEQRQMYLEGVLNAAPDAIVTLDARHRIVEWNAGAEKLFGYSPKEVIGQDVDDIITSPEVFEEAVGFTQTVMGGGEVLPTETIRYRKGGSPVDVIVAGSPIMVEDELIGTVAVYTDITERARMEEALKEYSERLQEMVEQRTRELREAQEQLIRAERLATIGQLGASVGHELRNPLGIISNSVYYLNMKLKDAGEKVKKHLKIMEEEIAISNKIINDLLGFARGRKPILEKAHLNTMVEEALSRSPMPDNVTVITELGGDLPPLMVDANQIEQVFINLILNAAQAMPDGGRLEIATRAGDGVIVAEFKDNGCGIPGENLEKIFEPLFTTRAKGIGLGLAVSKQLVEAHRGTIEVDSQVGRGTTFSVTLPISAG
jgi:PAS domain S-box-containing protein